MMIRFDQDHKRFNYRAVGININSNKVLLHKGEDEGFWSFPGGRVELGETSEQTLRREMLEEIGVKIEINRLIWFVENFFNFNNMEYHEISLYFMMNFPVNCQYLVAPEFRSIEDPKLIFKWFPLDSEVLSDISLRPSFLHTKLINLPTTIEHIVHKGE